MKKHKYLLALLLGGAVLRMWHIGWGLPELYEEATPMSIALRFWDSSSLNPHFFHYPALTFYIHYLGQALTYGIGHLFGFLPDFRSFESNITVLAILSRSLSAAFDLGTIAALYLLARET